MYKKEFTAKVAELFPLLPSVDFDYAHENEFCPWRVGFQSDYSPSLKRKLIAALLSEMLQCSVQTALKKVPKNIRYGIHEKRVDKMVSQFCVEELDDLAAYIREPQHSTVEGVFVSGLTLCRIPLSFRCLLTNANRGYLYETMAIARQLLELLGWAYAVRPLPSIDAAVAISPHKTIGQLNRFYPKAGRLYGYLSEHSHFMPNRHEVHVNIIESKVGTISQSVLYKGYALTLSVVLLDIVCGLRDAYYCKNLKKSAYLSKRSPPEFKTNRPTKKLIGDLKHLWPKEDQAFREICDLIV